MLLPVLSQLVHADEAFQLTTREGILPALGFVFLLGAVPAVKEAL